MREGDKEAQRYIENFKPFVNTKNKGMVGASRAVASKVGVTVVDGREMRATAEGGAGRSKIVNA